MKLMTKLLLAAVLFAVLPSALRAQDSEIRWIPGPTIAKLGDNLAEIEVPEGYLFADGDETRKLMALYGNPPTDQEVGLITPADDEKQWFLVFEYEASGYVKDDEKDAIDADAILESIREGTEQANEQRKEMGSAPLHVTGWFERPHYDEKTHNLVWAIEAQEEQAEDKVVNYDVRLLGRRGYMSVTLVTQPESLAAELPVVNQLLTGFTYSTGNRYAEFVQGDKVAEYGLTALVAGGAGAAAAKLGLFAKLGKVLAKAWKLVVLGLAALVAAVRKLFGGRREASA